MTTYLKIISKSFQRSITYKLEYYVGLLNAFLYIFIFSSVWLNVSKENPQFLGNWTGEKLVEYAILSTLIKVSFGKNDYLISTKIKSGDIVFDFLKPFNFYGMYLADSFGVSMFHAFARSIPLLIFSFLFFGIKPNIEIISILKFIPVYTMSFVLFATIGFGISCLSFFFTEIFSFMILYYALVTFMSGSVIPVDLLPQFILTFINYTPFPYLYYYPTMVLVNVPTSLSYIQLLQGYFIQLSVISLLSFLIYKYGRKKVEFAGG
jgi:ABC-2 type transport system permease protein